MAVISNLYFHSLKETLCSTRLIMHLSAKAYCYQAAEMHCNWWEKNYWEGQKDKGS